ncbi:MAG: oxygenase MpaB family protein [Pseudomonadota bacterium]|nr:oxygenase MpaB family protein [Pseudomonadota bacterium]
MSYRPKQQFNHPIGPEYSRPWGLFQNSRVRREISQLDATEDCQRIVFLLKAYEFPSDLTHALEMGLYHTYGSRTVAKLLDYTQEFENFGQKRYDDTYILIAQFMEAGWDNDLGARALKQVAKAHSRFAIKNDDYLFVLWTFIEFPIQWMRKYGWRKFTEHEEKAWYAYWLRIGEHMGIHSLPEKKTEFADFVESYEQREMVPNEYSERVSMATVRIMQGWLPKFLRPFVMPLAACISEPRFLEAINYDRPHYLMRLFVHSCLKLRALFKRIVSFDRFPDLLSENYYRTYPEGDYEIEKLKPDYFDNKNLSTDKISN